MLNIKRAQTLTKKHWELLLLADPSEKMVEEYIYKSEIFEALELNNIIGIIVLLENSEEEVEIKNIAIAPSFHGKGFGKQLIYFGIREAKRQGYSNISICTGNSSTLQLSLYQSCGFYITDIYQNFFIQFYPNEIWENGIRCTDLIKLEQNL